MPKAKKMSRGPNVRQQIANIKREINPLIRVRAVRGNPKPVNVNNTVFVSKTIQVVKQASGNATTLSIGDVLNSLGATEDLRIDFVKVWNATTGSSIKAILNPAVLLVNSNVSAPTSIQGEDFGTSSALAGLKFDIPSSLSGDMTQGATSNNIVSVNTGGSSDKVIFQVGLKFAV
jgi:hypothetical protein